MKKEDALTIQVSDYIRYQYPKAFFTHIANERRTSPMHGAKLKKMGVRAGLPDILIFSQKWVSTNVMLAGVAIELKVKPNKPTESQITALETLKKNGWVTDVCYDFETAKYVIDQYFNN